MNEEVLIRYLDEWMTLQGPVGLAFRPRRRLAGCGSVEVIEPFLRNVFWIDFWSILRSQRGSKMVKKVIFGRSFGASFSSAFLERFCVSFWTSRTSKIELSPAWEAYFYKIDFLMAGRKMETFCMRFGKQKKPKKLPRASLETSFFLTSFFGGFSPKIDQK